MTTNEQARALWLDVAQTGEAVEVALRGEAPQALHVRYRLELTGNSRARHFDATRITSGEPQVLSRMRVSAGDDWSATVQVDHGDGLEYTLREGRCRLPDRITSKVECVNPDEDRADGQGNATLSPCEICSSLATHITSKAP